MTYTPIQLAEAFIQAGELTDALNTLDAHLATAPDDATARRLRAAVCAQLPDRYQTVLDDLYALPRRTADDAMLLATVLERMSRPDDALTVLAVTHSDDPDDERLAEQYVMLLRKRGLSGRALIVAAQFPASWRWAQWSGDLHTDLGDHAAAVEHYTRALALLEARYPIDTGTAARVLETGAMSEAASLTVLGAYARLRLARAAAYTELGRYEAADADYVVAGQLIPGDPTILFNRGLLMLRRGDREAARRLCHAALEQATPALQAQMPLPPELT